MFFRRVVFIFLVLGVFLFVFALLGGILGLPWVTGPSAEYLLWIGALANIALGIWMFFTTLRDRTLSPAARLRWQMLLILGWGITAIVYLPRRLR